MTSDFFCLKIYLFYDILEEEDYPFLLIINDFKYDFYI